MQAGRRRDGTRQCRVLPARRSTAKAESVLPQFAGVRCDTVPASDRETVPFQASCQRSADSPAKQARLLLSDPAQRLFAQGLIRQILVAQAHVQNLFPAATRLHAAMNRPDVGGGGDLRPGPYQSVIAEELAKQIGRDFQDADLVQMQQDLEVVRVDAFARAEHSSP